MSDKHAQSGLPAAVRTTWRIADMDCPSCAAGLRDAAMALEGVLDAECSFAAGTLTVTFDPARVAGEQIVGRIRGAGHEAVLHAPTGQPADQAGRIVGAPPPAGLWREIARHRRLVATALSGLTLAAAVLAEWWPLGQPDLHIGLYLAAVAFGGFYVARSAGRSVLARRLDMNVLMTVAVAGALAIGQWDEAATVTFLFALSLWLEHVTMDRARRAIRSLLKLKPDRVRRLDEQNRPERVAPEQVAVGERIEVRPAERIGLDGQVVAGRSSVDQSAVTGESAPVSRGPGDEVLAGTVNLEATLTVRVSQPASRSAVSRIIEQVERAQAARSPAQRLVDRFARIYTPLVVSAAVFVAAVPPLLLGRPFLEPADGAHGWLYRALVLLVIACPCALVISTPVSVVSALASAARRGVLIKGGAHLETLGRVHCVVFDKTGTLTVGEPVVTDVEPADGLSAAELLRIAAALESHSEHPLARAVLHQARLANVAWPEPATIRVLPGLGVAGVLEDGEEHWLGNQRLARQRGADLSPILDRIGELESQGKTLVLLGRGGAEGQGGRVLGLIAAADQVRPSALAAIERLRQVSPSLHGGGGAEVGANLGSAEPAAAGWPAAGAAHRAHLVMLTGDNRWTARAIAEQLGIDGYAAELRPQEKVTQVRRLALHCTGAVAMVGDGINDAPALAAADVGIAMGTAGTDAAIETADVALIGDDLGGVPFAVRLGRRARRTIAQNIWLSVSIKAAFFALAVSGLATLWMAVFADMGASLLVTFNGLRLLMVRRQA